MAGRGELLLRAMAGTRRWTDRTRNSVYASRLQSGSMSDFSPSLSELPFSSASSSPSSRSSSCLSSLSSQPCPPFDGATSANFDQHLRPFQGHNHYHDSSLTSQIQHHHHHHNHNHRHHHQVELRSYSSLPRSSIVVDKILLPRFDFESLQLNCKSCTYHTRGILSTKLSPAPPPAASPTSMSTMATSVLASTSSDPQGLCGSSLPCKTSAEGGSPIARLTVRLGHIRNWLGLTRHVHLSLGHTSAVLGLLALFMKDILYLRTFLVCGSIFGLAFNLLRVPPLYLPAGWGCVFIIANIIQICILLHERREVDFQREESEVYELLFRRHGVTNHQFEKLMREAHAEWINLSPGDEILGEGQPVKKIVLILGGEAEVMVKGELVGEMIRGFLVGESALLDKDHVATATIVAKQNVRILSLDKERLWQQLSEDEQLSHSFAKLVSSDLAAKLLHNYKEISSHNYSFETYKEVLKAICADGIVDPREKRALREYRSLHHITNNQHVEALEAIGWTDDEFDDGAKHDHGHYYSVQAVWRLNKRLRGLLFKATQWAPQFHRRGFVAAEATSSSVPGNGSAAGAGSVEEQDGTSNSLSSKESRSIPSMLTTKNDETKVVMVRDDDRKRALSMPRSTIKLVATATLP